MTSIEWCRNADGSAGKSWNPIRARNLSTGAIGWHCEHVHEGCRNCYAERHNEKRFGTGLPYKPGHRGDIEIYLDEKTLLAPLGWRKPQRVFVCSMTDLFGEWVTDAWRDRILAVMSLCPRHTFIVLTKRPRRMRDYFRALDDTSALDDRIASLVRARRDDEDICLGIRPNLWLLVSCSEQKDADEFIPLVLDTPAAVRGVSCEPLLGPIELSRYLVTGDTRPLRWVIAGGESGPGARPMHLEWARSLHDQCAAAGVPFFFKQWGAWCPHKIEPGGDLGGDVHAGRVRIVHPAGQSDVEVFISTGWRSTLPGSRYMVRLGKKAAGRLLDGREHSEWPQGAAR